jgi:carbamate kinase
MKTILLAVGGNSLIRAGEKGTAAEQLANAQRTAAEIAILIRAGYSLVITHGNGPQVGAALLRSERAANQVPGQPLDVCGACSQGEIGYLLEQALVNELAKVGLHTPVIAMLTQSIVAVDDPAMRNPTKPIGPFYSRQEAEERRRTLGWQIVEDASRGYRRIVPSPNPIDIVELDVIRDLAEHGVLVIACGGGGIPVVRQGGQLHGTEAVIDKDRASALLATKLNVALFVISTDADYVYLDYKKPTQRALTSISATELQEYLIDGQFPAGNMGPKIESVQAFLRAGGKEAIITSSENLSKAVRGEAGTHILPDTVDLIQPAAVASELSAGRR